MFRNPKMLVVCSMLFHAPRETRTGSKESGFCPRRLSRWCKSMLSEVGGRVACFQENLTLSMRLLGEIWVRLESHRRSHR